MHCMLIIRDLDHRRRKFSLGTRFGTVMVLPACAGENLDFGVGLRLKCIMSKRFWHLD